MKKHLLVATLLTFSAAAFADDCAVDMTSNDQMQYDLKEVTVPKSCESFTINLAHIGRLPKAAMGHNVVIAKSADKMAVAADGIAAGLDHQYVKPDDARVIAFSPMIGGGEKTKVTFKTEALEAGGDYSYFCTFPGHISVMTGKLTVK